MKAIQNNRCSFGRWIRIGLTLLGLVIIAAALLVDVIIGGLSSGIGPLQLIATLCGLLLMIFPWLPLTLVGRGGLVLVSVLVMIVLLEVALSLAGFKPEYHAPPNFDPIVATGQPNHETTRVVIRTARSDAGTFRVRRGQLTMRLVESPPTAQVRQSISIKCLKISTTSAGA